jgi:hypothetical protein
MMKHATAVLALLAGAAMFASAVTAEPKPDPVRSRGDQLKTDPIPTAPGGKGTAAKTAPKSTPRSGPGFDAWPKKW